MKITRLGPISKSDFTLNDLTIFTGNNNQGKTYMSYAVYGILKSLNDISLYFYSLKEVDILNNDGQLIISLEEFQTKLVKDLKSSISQNWSNILRINFQTEENMFSDSKLVLSEKDILNFFNFTFSQNQEYKNTIKYKNFAVTLTFANNQFSFSRLEENISESNSKSDIDEDLTILHTILMVLTESFINRSITAFYIPAERVGLNVFRSQLNSNKIQLLDTLTQHFNSSNDHLNISQPISEFKPYLAKPINDYLKFINGINKYDINDNDDSLGRFIREKLINGRFDIDKNTDKSFFRSRHSTKKYKKDYIPLHVTSSSIKSFYGLDYYLENLNTTNTTNFIIIDEPEMNLHPSIQVEFINFIELLLLNNIKILISTHSDFLIKKIQNVALKNRNTQDDNKGIVEENISVYNFANNTMKKVDIFSDEDYTNFSQTIYELEHEFFDALEANIIDSSDEERK